MIRPLRRTHLYIWAALALLLPILVVSAITARKIPPPLPQHAPQSPIESDAR